MSYYTAGFRSCATRAQFLVMNLDDNGNITTSAQCGAFAWLLESALAMNGIHSNWVTVQTAYADPIWGRPKMVIRDWCFIGDSECPAGAPSYVDSGPYPWIYQLSLNAATVNGGDYMVPSPSSFGDLTNSPGVPGQGEMTPAEKVFDSHFIVQVTVVDNANLAGDQYFDPSYGVTYPSPSGFATQAIAGYACQLPPENNNPNPTLNLYCQGNLSTGTFHVFRPVQGIPDISFTPVPENSM